MNRELHFTDLSMHRQGGVILDKVNGVLKPGKVTVILGANGAGKSSLLSCLAGLSEESRRSVFVGRNSLLDMGDTERARLIGFLPQRGEVHWNMQVEALVALGRMVHSGGGRLTGQDRVILSQVMRDLDLTHLAERPVLTLSGGEQARALLARVLAGDPQWLLADEPLANLDPAHQLSVLSRLRQVADKGKGVVVVLHDVLHAARVADEVMLMKQGQIIAQGPRDAILTPRHLQEIFGIDFRRVAADGPPLLIPV